MTARPVQKVLHFTDPRLGMRIEPARLDDLSTRAAMRLLDDVLAGAGDRAVAAPAIGLPVRCLALRQGGDVLQVLNPVISAAGRFRLNRAETGAVTGPIRRHAWRADRVTLTGVQPSGLALSEVVEGALAVSVQQAMDLLDDRAPFDWITPFHRMWATTTSAVLRTRAEGVNRALHLAPWQDDAGAASAAAPLLALDARRVRMRDDAGQAVGVLDTADPSLPLDAIDRRCLGVLLATSALREVMVLSPQRAPLAVALLSMVPGVLLRHPVGGWPSAAMAALQLASGCRSIDPSAPLPAAEDEGKRLDAILIEGDAPDLQGPDALAGLRGHARRLTGQGGVALICCPAVAPATEDLLQAVFPVLYLIDDPQAGAIYVAAKSRLDLDAARARAMRLANQLGRPELLRPATEGWQLIAKSGDRSAL